MIVGVAQVVVNVADVAAARSAFDGAEAFTALDQPVPAAADSFLARPRTLVDVVHVERGDAVGVQLTRFHGDPPTGRAPYLLKLDAGEAPVVTVGVSEMAASIEFWRAGMRFMHGRSTGEFTAPAM